jgi:hypothetical protein
LNDELEDIVEQRTHELKEALHKLELSREEIDPFTNKRERTK